ncbi:helix-turn-helix domain-containing protein [Thermovibrio sp.]
MELTKKWLTTKEAEKYSNLCFKTLKKYRDLGYIKGRKAGNKWLWNRESIDAFLDGIDEELETQIALHEVLKK